MILGVKEKVVYTASFLEGEGGFGTKKKGRGQASISASQKQRWPLERLQEWWGGEIYPDRDSWRWEANGWLAHLIITCIKPYMSPRRLDQINRLPMYVSRRTAHSPLRQEGYNRRYFRQDRGSL